MAKRKPNYTIQKIPGYTREEVILARTIWMEARGEGARGMQASGNVFLNRVAIAANSPKYEKMWGKGIEGVATHWNRNKWGGKTFMFSAWDPRDPNFKKGENVNIYTPSFVTALRVSKGLVRGLYRDNSKGADHYYAPGSASPNWGNKGVTTARLGRHKFKNLTRIDGRKYRPTGRRMASNTTLKRVF